MKLHDHKEAFCLMEYATDSRNEVEWLWNSRDGVTPFVIHTATGAEMTHSNWHRDRKIEAFVPPLGMRVFVDSTKDRLRAALRRRVDRYWEEMSSHSEFAELTKQEAVEKLLEAEWKEGMPDVVEVTPELRDEFAARAAKVDDSTTYRGPLRFA